MSDINNRLAAALVAAQQAAHAVQKKARNQYHKYAYASSEAVIAEARTALSSAGLALVPVDFGIFGETQCWLQVTYDLIHESGEHLCLESRTPIVVEKGRPLDKATAAAKTYDLAYLLRGLLLLPRVEEGTEVDQRDDSHRASTSSRPTAPPPKPSQSDDAVLLTQWTQRLEGCDSRLALHAAITEATQLFGQNHPLRDQLRPVVNRCQEAMREQLQQREEAG